MKLHDVLKKAESLVTPSQNEEKKVTKISSEIKSKVEDEAKKCRINAHLIAGGSAAKGTWLPGFSDIDFFLVFDYDSFSDRSAGLSIYAEKILKNIFKLTRMHGSRDYFSAKYKNYNVEIIPVLDISDGQEPKNLTDFSPQHVVWFNKHAKNNPKLRTEVRLAKQFFKSAGVYGAESYIRGFSGHVIEILTVAHGSFQNLTKAALKWKYQQVIDVERYYRNEKEVFANLNESKLASALILVDPVEKNRNASAALDKENFNLAKDAVHKFLDNPSIVFFTEKKFSVEDLKRKKRDLKLIVIDAKTSKSKPDVAGAKLRKEFEAIERKLAENDLVVQDSGWHISENKAKFWFYFDKTALLGKKEHIGPPVALEKYAADFRKKWKSVRISNGRLVAEIKRIYTKPEQLLKDLKTKFRVY